MRTLAWLAVGSLGLACSPAGPAEVPPAELVVMTAAPGPTASASAPVIDEPPPERVSVELFVMSRCPYGTRAELTWAEAVRRLGNVDLRVGFVGTVGPEGELKSMRGPSELTGDAAQICAMKYSTKWLEMIQCQNRNVADVDFNWRECAADLGMPVDTIEACAFGDEAKSLLAQSFTYGISKGANASPTMFVADQKYTGGRAPKDLIAAVCAASKSKPEICGSIATTPEVPIKSLFDRRCTTCDTPRVDGDALAIILNPKLSSFDYQSPDGRALFDSVQPSRAPLYLFGAELDGDTVANAKLAPRLRMTKEGRVLEDGVWNPRCADAGGCAAPECKAALPCRAERPKHIALHLEDSSPLSSRAVFALREVLESFERQKSPLTFSIHQVAQNPRRGAAPAKPAELDEARRRLCVQKQKPGKPLLAYLFCRAAAQPEDSWQSCAGGKTGLDAAAIGKCADGTDGSKLLEASRKRARESGVESGATFIVNERGSIRTIHADALKQAVCSANHKLAGCDASLSSVLLK